MLITTIFSNVQVNLILLHSDTNYQKFRDNYNIANVYKNIMFTTILLVMKSCRLQC